MVQLCTLGRSRMIVEFIGSTGAGKTTLISEVRRRVAAQAPSVASHEVAARRLGLHRVTNPTIQNFIQDLVGLPLFLGSLYRHRSFVAFVLGILARHDNSVFYAANYVRSIVRKIGVYEMVRRCAHDQVIFVDEGTVLSAHLLFVYTRTRYSRAEIEQFASLVPRPDVLVYIKAPIDCLVQRSLQRLDVRREMRAKSRAVVEAYVTDATAVFDQLVITRPLCDRVLMVENPNGIPDERAATVERVARFILEARSTTGRSSSETYSG